MLEQGRYTWRHNNVLNLLYKFMKEAFDDTYTVFADLPEIGHCTIPPHVILTSQRPDIVILSETKKDIVIVELSVPFEMNIETRHVQKCNKYAPLVNDIVNQGYNCQLICLEVGPEAMCRKETKADWKHCSQRWRWVENSKPLCIT